MTNRSVEVKQADYFAYRLGLPASLEEQVGVMEDEAYELHHATNNVLVADAARVEQREVVILRHLNHLRHLLQLLLGLRRLL